MTHPNTRQARQRSVLAGVLFLLAMVGLVTEEQLARPSLLTLTQFYVANLLSGATGRVPLFWSIEMFNATLSLEGTSGDDAPIQLRIITPGGDMLTTDAMSRLDPSRNVGVCPMHRPSAGTAWWSGRVPEAMASELRARGTTGYRVEVLKHSSWYDVLLVDSGCRGVGRL